MKKDIKFIVGLSGWGKSTCIQKIVGSSGSKKQHIKESTGLFR
jgi:putative ribosome biogenesis GTPase RsgA